MSAINMIYSLQVITFTCHHKHWITVNQAHIFHRREYHAQKAFVRRWKRLHRGCVKLKIACWYLMRLTFNRSIYYHGCSILVFQSSCTYYYRSVLRISYRRCGIGTEWVNFSTSYMYIETVDCHSLFGLTVHSLSTEGFSILPLHMQRFVCAGNRVYFYHFVIRELYTFYFFAHFIHLFLLAFNLDFYWVNSLLFPRAFAHYLHHFPSFISFSNEH